MANEYSRRCPPLKRLIFRSPTRCKPFPARIIQKLSDFFHVGSTKWKCKKKSRLKSKMNLEAELSGQKLFKIPSTNECNSFERTHHFLGPFHTICQRSAGCLLSFRQYDIAQTLQQSSPFTVPCLTFRNSAPSAWPAAHCWATKNLCSQPHSLIIITRQQPHDLPGGPRFGCP